MMLFGEIRCNVMSVDFGNLPPKENIKFGMTPLSAKDKIKSFRKAILSSFVPIEISDLIFSISDNLFSL